MVCSLVEAVRDEWCFGYVFCILEPVLGFDLRDMLEFQFHMSQMKKRIGAGK